MLGHDAFERLGKGWWRIEDKALEEIEKFEPPLWVMEQPNYTIQCASFEDFERHKAMIEFCVKYENESFELFYKWFVKNKGKED